MDVAGCVDTTGAVVCTSLGFRLGLLALCPVGLPEFFRPIVCVCCDTTHFPPYEAFFLRKYLVRLPKSPALRYSPGHPSPFHFEAVGSATCNTEASLPKMRMELNTLWYFL